MKKNNSFSPPRHLDLPIPIIGLTGGIATGKSSASDYLQKKGLPLLCADNLVKEVYKNEDVIKEISIISPNSVVGNRVDFPKLRSEFFNSNDIKEKVEALIYQHLPNTFLNQFHQLGKIDYFIYDIPLLFEKNLYPKFDYTLLVYSPRNIQFERLVNRDQISDELANKILDQQMSIEDKKNLTENVIENTETLEDLYQKLDLAFNFFKV